MSLKTWKPLLILASFCLFLLMGAIPAFAQYWPDGCLYRRAITIDHTKVPNTDQANFPVLISGTYSYLATTANGGNVTNANGYDILFTSDADGVNPIPFEQESYSPSTGAINYWVKVPTLSHTTDTVIYMFYGNSSISTDLSNKTAVWDSNYLGIWHSGESSGNLQDSTSNNNPAVPTSLTQGAAGQIGNAATYNGSTSHAAIGNLSLFNPTLITVSAWVKATSYPNTLNTILGKDQSSDPYVGYDLRVDGGHLNFYIATGGAGSYRAASTTQPSTGAWHHVVGTYDGSNIKLFVDGALVSSVADSGNMDSANGSLWLGDDSSFNGRNWNGSIDEARISNTARSADWIATEYTNQSSPSSFYSVGAATAGVLNFKITGLSPSTANFGDVVAIQGTNFGSTQGSSTVSLNGTTLAVQNWSNTSISVAIPYGASSGYFLVTINSQPAMSPFFTVRPIPSGWSDGDIGSVGVAGSGTYANGTFTVKGAGLGTGGTSDGFHFAYQPLSGDGTIIARVTSLQGGTSPAAGVMIRETLATGSTFAYTADAGGVFRFYYRTSTGATSTGSNASSGSLPYWVKVVRSGSTFSGYDSLDGVNWVQLGTSQTISMAQSVYVGLVVTSGSASSLATATFDSVSINSTASPAPVITSVSATTGSVGSQVVISGSGFGASQNGSLVLLNDAAVPINSWSSTSIIITIPTGATSGPLLVSVAPTMNNSNSVNFAVTSQPLLTPWLDQDVGSVGVAGSATYANGTFTVKGAGQGTFASSDGFHYVYQPLSGDGTIVARVVSYQGGSGGAAGVMIRETLDPGARFAFESYYAACCIYLWDRTSPGTSASYQADLSHTLPYWVKLIRSGTTFATYGSTDGVNWTQLGTNQTISMAQNVYVGLGVTSNITTALATATFDNVSLTVGTTPFVTGVSPDLGGAGTSVTITGSNFGSSQGTSTAKFNGTAASSITSWSNTQIVAVVSSATPGGPGPVTVTVNSITSPSNVSFTMVKPVINSLTPPAAQTGGTITLNGTGFGSNSLVGSVQFNGVSAQVSSWSDTAVTVTVPSNATSGPVTLTENGITSNGVQFTVLEALTVTGISPGSGAVGSTVTITGTGFGATQSNSSAVFYLGGAGSVTSWSDTQIVVSVPSGAGSGQLGMCVGGQCAWSTSSFTLTERLQLTDSLGNQTTYTSAQIGGHWVPSSSQGSGCSSCTLRGTISYTYDSNGNALSRTDENGHTTTYTYDSNGNVLTMTVPINSTTTATTSYTYNSFGEVLTTTDPLGNVTTNTYDANGNLLTVTTPAPNGNTAASVTTFTYDTKGELLTVKDPLNNVTTLTYTAAGLIATITDAQNNVTTYGYDTHGNRTSVTDALNHQTTFTYDAMDRLTKITYPDTTTTQFGYDYRGRRTTVTDQNGKVTTYAYDDADRLITVTDAATPANVTTYGYDTENNLTSIKDASNNTTSFNYDAFGRVTKTTFPSGYIETYGYDAVGNLTNKTDRKNQQITYTYDQLNRLTQKLYPDSTTVNYTYDNDSRLTQVTDPTGTYQFTFDNMGRLTNTTTSYAFLTGRNFTTSYAYDAASNRTGFTDPESGSSTYAYDTLNRLQTLTPPVAIASGNFGFTYDALSRRTQMTRPNGLKSIYAYDNLSRLLSVLHQSGTTTLDGAAYAVDNAGNRTSRTPQPSGTATNYGYDNIYELLSATGGSTESYTYDAVGNRLTSGAGSYGYNTSNEMTSSPTATYTYDNNGNTLTKVVGSNTTTNTWDYENRLTSVTLPGSGGTVSFKYDPFGRRIYKSSSSGTSVFAYDGDNLAEETNASGTAVARYSQGLNIDEPLAMLRGGATSFYHADGLGSVTSLSSAAGSIAQTYTFDSFGKLTASTGSLVNPFQYTARESDTETGLYYYRARYYDQNAGRFTSEDPFGFGAGVDFYRYVYNSPAGLADPMGLSPADVQRIQAKCKKCTQGLTDAGMRLNGGNGDTTLGFVGSLLTGGINDLLSAHRENSTNKKQSCYSQAVITKPCLEDPKPPYAGDWQFNVERIWGGSHRVVIGRDSDPGDPVVICDPWLNRTYTLPKPPAGPTGGGSAF